MKSTKYYCLVLFFLLFGVSLSATAINQEKFDRLTSLMIKGCSLGQSVEISASGSAGISFLKKGIEGKFETKQSEIPAIIEFLTKDEAKSKQADKTRECMTAYMNKLFDAELNSDNKVISSESPVTLVKNGVIYDFEGCNIAGRNNLECKFKITSSLIDRIISINSNYSTLYDSSSNKFTSTGAAIANNTGNANGVRDVALISDMPTKMVVFYKNVPSNLNVISRLRVAVRSKTESGSPHDELLELRDVGVIR